MIQFWKTPSESDDFRYMGCKQSLGYRPIDSHKPYVIRDHVKIFRFFFILYKHSPRSKELTYKYFFQNFKQIWSTEFISILASIREHMTDNRDKFESSTFRWNFSKTFYLLVGEC